ncbi:synaptonemal complex protein 1 [Labrus bergylta]|uniref:synaptonemal complex protein 1 n=1 Tax=Labrus bergylta TaxID=56723 RepID=UPI003313F7C8
MERVRDFTFKLWVPPRVNEGQVSAVRPQDNSKCFDKEQSLPFVSTSVVGPTRQDFSKMKVVPPMEKEDNNLNPGKLYTKLFDEVEKIKYWKIKADSDTVQKERRLQENKRTIETQQKAIQELQFGNESLAIKLEERISENEDLRNKHNATRNLCNLLKDTFERSAEKMHLFESEREETHHIFMENSGSIQKLIAAFEGLRTQAEADQQEMQKVKVGLQQFEIVKEKFKEEFDMKEKEVAVLQTDLQKQENELQKILLDFHETQKHCKQLKDATNEQYELLKSSETEKESLLQKLQRVEQCLKESDEQREVIAALLKENKEEYAEMIQSRDFSLQELSRVKNQQAEKLEQIQTTMQELQNSLSSEIQKAEELEDKLIANKGELESKSTLLGESLEQSAMKDGRIKDLEDELGEHLQEEITEKETKIKSVETKVAIILLYEIKVIYNYSAHMLCLFFWGGGFQNKVLKEQIAKEIAKSYELETVINNLYEESQNLQKLLNDLESKSTSATELENEVKKLRITTAEAVKNKDEAELKCQQKIADMVALMEKHKRQYDRMVEEKDAELDENKKREMEAVCQKKSLELDLLKNKTDNVKLKQQLKTEVSKKANLQKELLDLKKEMSSMKIIQLSGSGNKQSPALKSTQGKSSDTPNDSFAKRHVFDFSESRKTPSHSKVTRSTAVMKNDEIQSGDLKTPQSLPKRIGGTSKIKSYRIRTPPSTEKAVCWKKTIELDPKSDSSDLGDLLTFASALPANFSATSCEQNIFKKIQSPAVHKSPGNFLKLAAMKRMRDAGWTTVTGCNKKKKRTNEKIFA